MAAFENQQEPDGSQKARRPTKFLSRSELIDRLEEEINRASRHSTSLCCLLLRLENIEKIQSAHGSEFSERLVGYAGATLRAEFRRYDRLGEIGDGEFMVLLPGVDGLRGEVVARRVLSRLRAIKIAVEDQRLALRVSISVVFWRREQTAEQFVADVRAATPHEQLSLKGAVRI